MSVVLAEPTEPGPAGLEEWAQSFLTLARVSGEMARTAFVPNSLRVFRNNGRDYDNEATAAQVTAAILTGRELGLEPMAALRSINVINATPALSALALRAIVLAAGHRIWVEEATNTRAVVAGVRAGDTHEQRVSWTMDDARDRGLVNRPNWRTQRRNMLIARATAEVARLVAADAILGVPYVIEELEDEDAQTSPLPAPPADTKPLKRRRQPAPALVSRSQPRAEPAVPEDEPPLDDEPPTSQPQPINDSQLRALQAGFRDLGLDRTQRLAFTSTFLKRDVTTAKDLTGEEASRLLDEIGRRKALAQAPPDDTQQGQAVAAEQPASAPPAAQSQGARGPAAPSGGEQQTLGQTEETIGPDALDHLTWLRREANVDDRWLRIQLVELGVKDPPQNITRDVLKQLTRTQANRLKRALSSEIDQRNDE